MTTIISTTRETASQRVVRGHPALASACAGCFFMRFAELGKSILTSASERRTICPKGPSALVWGHPHKPVLSMAAMDCDKIRRKR